MMAMSSCYSFNNSEMSYGHQFSCALSDILCKVGIARVAVSAFCILRDLGIKNISNRTKVQLYDSA